MKNVVIFFLFLCVNLAGAFHYVHAGAYSIKNCFSPVQDLEKTHQIEGGTAFHDYFLNVNTSRSGENSNLIGIEDEDENEDIIKKRVSQSRYFLALCYAFISNYHYSFFTDRILSYKHLPCTSSCKYILQRALRI